MPSDGRPAVQRRKVWLTPTSRVPCSNAAKTRKPSKLPGVPQITNRSQPLVGRSSPYGKDMWGRYCCFPTVDTCLSCEYIVRQSCAMVLRWRIFGDFLRPVFSASHVQHVSDLRPKFALRPHHTMCGSMVDNNL